ncbi:MAG: DUF11 domain-containing protein [Planctomycetaceae bacterium]|nr:DUF11 domain-containing protein [Planctomycetaceae bacterium]
MRRSFWILSTPLVAGGLVWAVNAADQQTPRTAKTPAAQTGKIFNFARNAKLAADPQAADDFDAEASEGDQPPVRYVRQRSGQGATPARPKKNLYQQLLGDERTEHGIAAAHTSEGRSTKPERTSKLPPAEDLEAAEETAAGGRETPTDDHPPATTQDELQLTGAESNADAVEHAEYQSIAGRERRQVQQVQQTVKSSARRSKADVPIVAPPADEEEREAPPAPPITKPTRGAPAKGAPAPTARPVTTARIPPRTQAGTTRTTAGAAAAAQGGATRKAAAPAVAAAAPAAQHAGATQTPAVTTDISDVPLISLKWIKNGEINVGQKCQCGLVVKNAGKLPAKDVVVEAQFPRSVKLIDAQPLPNDSKDHLAWIFEHLEPGAERTITITMIPGRRGDLATSATVRFTGVASHVLKVEEPQLALAVDGPHEVMVGDTTTQLITVSNPGTGVAHDVVVHAHLPEGLEHPRGKVVEMGVGSLGPGETREVRLPLAATAGGESTLQIEARGTNLLQKAQTKITIAAPRLKIEVVGPSLRYINRHAQYSITVTNDGVAATDNVRIVHLVPEGFEFIKADRGGKYDVATAALSWFVGRLEAGQSTLVACDLNAKKIGSYEHHFQTSGENGSTAAAKLDTKIDSASSIVMEVADLDDPVEIETQTAYEIKIRNDGSKAAQSLRLACELPAGVQLLGTDGPSEHDLEKGTLVFRPLTALAAGDKVTYRIKVQGKTAGNLRLRAKLTTSSSTEPLIVEELTKFYAD